MQEPLEASNCGDLTVEGKKNQSRNGIVEGKKNQSRNGIVERNHRHECDDVVDVEKEEG